MGPILKLLKKVAKTKLSPVMPYIKVAKEGSTSGVTPSRRSIRGQLKNDRHDRWDTEDEVLIVITGHGPTPPEGLSSANTGQVSDISEIFEKLWKNIDNVNSV
ncbi:hypothetical protein AVEN_156767-1 [Araneus ventricosus]|uniref:Uncharacterized protein n=1 Tax=Araneus ventricosus TaxID=182803 RepID=A0A4Y2FZ71_ARAVE|nr:hypothetical protein AVEN_156767-1 [Araneus ventricosus]